MKAFRVSAMVIAVLVAAASCDKDDNNSTPTTLSRIQAKWGVASKVIDSTGTAGDSTYTGVAADYMDFKTDNKVYSQLNNVKDTAAYSLTNDSTLVLDGVISKITALSSSQFVVKQMVIATTGTTKDTTYVTFNLKK